MKSKLEAGQHLSLSQQINLLSELMLSVEHMPRILDAVATLPNAWVGAGIIFQNVWNVLHGYELNQYIKDIDVFYWDANDLSWEGENVRINQLKSQLPDVGLPLDVKNIARVHLWYEQTFGIAKEPYLSVEESVSTWPVIGACIAMRMKEGELEFIAPYGFQDMFMLRVRPNKVLIRREIYAAKAVRWKQQWPLLDVKDW